MTDDVNYLIKESLQKMLDYINKMDEGQQQEVGTNGTHYGPVKKLTGYHAVQKVNRSDYAIHILANLDKVPTLNNDKSCIRYKNGCGTVIDRCNDEQSVPGRERDIADRKRKAPNSR